MNGRNPVQWPKGVEQVGIEDLGRLGIDRDGQLFWDGRPVEIRQALSLSRLQKVLAVVVTVFAILGGLGGFVTGLNNLSVFLCVRGKNWLSCPLPSIPAAAGSLPTPPAVQP